MERVEWKVVQGIGGEKEIDGEEDIKKEEIERALKKIKDGKAIKGDGIPAEMWKYEGKEMKEWV